MSSAIPRDLKYFQERTTVTEFGCWEWKLYKAKAGHNRGGYYGRTCRAGEQRPIGAHQLAYEVLVGAIPAGHEIDHTCRNTLCCNPEHLEAVTSSVNNQRKWDSGDGRNQNTSKEKCGKCGEPYTMESQRGDGRKFRGCEPCYKEYQRTYYQKNRERIRANQNAARSKKVGA